jgi:hypothetical protein
MKKQFNLLATAIMATLVTTSAQAIQFDGFMTVGATKMVDIDKQDKKNVYIGGLGDRGITDDVTFERDTRFGLQISSDITEKMSVVSQILARADKNNFNAIIEWAYIDYKITDYASVHAGKIKQPVYLVNDYVEVGYAYPWIRPPGEVYMFNNPLNTVNGIELLLQFPVGKGTLSFQPYLGSNSDDIPNTQGSKFEADNIYGMDIKYSGKGYTAHASAFTCDVKTKGQFNTTANFPGIGTVPVAVDLNGKGKCDVYATGFNLDIKNVVVYAEYQNRKTDKSLEKAFGDTSAWYTTIGYRIGKFLPHLTYARSDGTASNNGLPGNGAATVGPGNPASGASFNFPVAIQQSVTAGLRYEVNDSAALKVEYQVVNIAQDQRTLDQNGGTNYGLFNTDFNRAPPQKNVGIMSVALDVIF